MIKKCTSRTYDNSFTPTEKIAKQALNKLTGNRQIGIQEALHDICGLDLVICSDILVDVQLNRSMYLSKTTKKVVDRHKFNNQDIVDSYKRREHHLKNVSLENYFYKCFRKKEFYKDNETGRQKYRILIAKGLNCRPKHPVDYDYARGMIIMHKPWSINNPLTTLLSNKQRTIDTFKYMIRNRKFPFYVLAEYHRAFHYATHHRFECIAKQGVKEDNAVDLNDLNEEELEQEILWEHSCHLSAQNSRTTDNVIGEDLVDVGLEHDWSKSFFKGTRSPDTMDGEKYIGYLKDIFYGDDIENDKLFIPKKKDGSDYKIEDLNPEQQELVISAISTIIKFLTNDPTYKPLRATTMGCGGTGKSFLINTLVSLIRRYTQQNDTIKVAAPSGGAAYNVGGCTLHRCLDLKVEKNFM